MLSSRVQMSAKPSFLQVYTVSCFGSVTTANREYQVAVLLILNQNVLLVYELDVSVALTPGPPFTADIEPRENAASRPSAFRPGSDTAADDCFHC